MLHRYSIYVAIYLVIHTKQGSPFVYCLADDMMSSFFYQGSEMVCQNEFPWWPTTIEGGEKPPLAQGDDVATSVPQQVSKSVIQSVSVCVDDDDDATC